MTQSKYHPELTLAPCANCNSANVQDGGDDFDADVICNDCRLITPVFLGTRNAINAWNDRLYMDQWVFLGESLDPAREFMIMI
jgi:hypothetical protein